MAAATLAIAAAVVANPVLPTLPDVTIPAMFPSASQASAAQPVVAGTGAGASASTSRFAAAPVSVEIAAPVNPSIAAVHQAAPAVMTTSPGKKLSAAIVRAAQAGSPPIAAARTAFEQKSVRVPAVNSVVDTGGDPARSVATFGSATGAAAVQVQPAPLPVAAVHVPPPMAAVRVPSTHEDPPPAGEVHPPTVRPGEPTSPRKRR